ncbi:DNA cytosine methyltransferase [Pseudomonas mosselii]|uniref:Cytosine-specific methyltransferase n=1 Tax=Pseudomonas mosselii TaxID=78327 RepID=A0AA42S113_9PSED|nr:DNA cytosine methyltransferase [Pseudomonas mosselii]MDH1632286.1 DNA cytosine methyltransferase [Pseudomonas mosselii]
MMPVLLDLFSGCGGLTLGSHRAGFTTALAVDVDPILSSSFASNFPGTRLLVDDVASLTPAKLSELLPNTIDGVIGGPPCQAFSEMGLRRIDDPRRTLLSEFFRVVADVKPAFFLMENVPGLLSDKNRHVLDEALEGLGGRWDILGPIVLDASDFGAPTRRRRVFVFGFDSSKITVPSLEYLIKSDALPTNVRDAIFDLNGAVQSDSNLTHWEYGGDLDVSPYAARMLSTSGRFTGHQRTVHKPETISRFSTVKPGSVDPVGKHKRLDWSGLCPTLRAGTGSDRGSYQAVRPLHPTEDRVITPREAARLQGFPDDFIFHQTVWHSFRMIGNSVSPIISEALLKKIFNLFSQP